MITAFERGDVCFRSQVNAGAEYRRLSVENLSQFEGAGVPEWLPGIDDCGGAAFVSVRDYRAGELHDADGYGQLGDADRGVQSACGTTVPGWHDYSDVHRY